MDDPREQQRPLLIFDGDCGFCRRWIRRWRVVTGDRVEYAPYQEVAGRFPQIPYADLERAVHLVDSDGTVYVGAHAVFRSLAVSAVKSLPLWVYRHVPGFAPVTEAAYRFVADHRRGLSRITHWVSGPDVGPPSYLLTRWLFVRLLAVVYFIAFVSLGVQILGLIGSNGILPAVDHLEDMRARLGDEAVWRLPTLAWLSCSDTFLQFLCWGGAAVSVLVMLRIAPAPLLLVLWVMYLSLCSVGQTFLGFQWDTLLLETGFLGIFFASWKLRPRLSTEPPPSRLARWLIIWLAFRLMFTSGIVKLLDDSQSQPTWHDLTALNYHYFTTCLPNVGSWYAHQLPEWFQKFSVLCMFAIEIGAPLLFFMPRRLRLFAFVLQIVFQMLIMLTGNYNFFNLLTIVICLSLVDDAFLRRFFPRRWGEASRALGDRPSSPVVQRVATVGFAFVVLLVSGMWMARTLRTDRSDRGLPYGALPQPARDVIDFALRFKSINTYGLFRSMTTRRREIIVEGSDDRASWKAYEFKWKPGDIGRRPAQVAPHQPRLDWQMWFAALGNYRSPRNRWFLNFEKRLLEGSPEVLALLGTNPFPNKPPRYIRAVLYDYRFTGPETRREEGTSEQARLWWTRKRLGLYTPVLSLDSFRRR